MKKFLFLPCLILLLFSCKPQQIITERIVSDTTIVREVTKLIEVPGATIASPSINIDSLATLLRNKVPVETINNTLYYQDPETNLRVGLLIDELGNLSALCEQQDRVIELQVQEIERLRQISEQSTIIQKPSTWKIIKDAAIAILIGFILGVSMTQIKSVFPK